MNYHEMKVVFLRGAAMSLFLMINSLVNAQSEKRQTETSAQRERALLYQRASAMNQGTVAGPGGPSCGNGIVESGEECDPPNMQTCNSNCEFVLCGNDVVAGNCQTPFGPAAWLSTECEGSEFYGPRVASFDDFLTGSGGLLTSVCWWSIWSEFGSIRCDPRPANFIVRVYADSSGLPGSIIGERTVANVTMIESWAPGWQEDYNYHATLNPGISLLATTKYWLSITDNSACPTEITDCRHFWMAAQTAEGNDAAVTSRGSPACYEDLEYQGIVHDLTWCLDIDNSAPIAGSTNRACCTISGCILADSCACMEVHQGTPWLDETQCDPSSCAATCGNGVIEGAEACDPPDGIACDNSCQFVVCGDGVIEGSEECDPPDGATCTRGCQLGCEVFSTDFDSGVAASFSGVTTLEGVQNFAGLGTDGIVFSGDFLRNSTGSTFSGGPQPSPSVLTLTNLPPHSGVSLSFLLAIINSWDGTGCTGPDRGPDLFNVRVDGNLIFSQVFENSGCGSQSYLPLPAVLLAYGDPLGFGDGGEYNDSAYDLGLDPLFKNIAHSANTLTVEWFASGIGWQGGNDESWAIDHVDVMLIGVGCEVCGDGIVQGTEDCDPPDNLTCNQFCETIFCGDGIVEGAEQCDPPAPYSCNNSCLLGPCGVGAQNCCAANPSPGCQDASCCETVCACDPFCCQSAWDGACAGDGFGGNGCGATVLCTCAAPPPEVLADPLGNKIRFISFSVPASPTAAGAETALRVRLFSLHHVVPPYSGGASIPFTSFEGQVRWVGPPGQYVESSSNPTTFYASSLQCTPHYQDWSTVGLLHVTGSAIVPSSIYEVENVAASCAGIEASCTAVSAPLPVATTRWGDVAEAYNPPAATAQPDFNDIQSMVAKFRSAPGAPIKARVLIAGNDSSGNIDVATITIDFNFTHIAACVDAFRGKPYPHSIAACP